MAADREDFNLTFPNSLTAKRFFHRHCLKVRGFALV